MDKKTEKYKLSLTLLGDENIVSTYDKTFISWSNPFRIIPIPSFYQSIILTNKRLVLIPSVGNVGLIGPKTFEYYFFNEHDYNLFVEKYSQWRGKDPEDKIPHWGASMMLEKSEFRDKSYVMGWRGNLGYIEGKIKINDKNFIDLLKKISIVHSGSTKNAKGNKKNWLYILLIVLIAIVAIYLRG